MIGSEPNDDPDQTGGGTTPAGINCFSHLIIKSYCVTSTEQTVPGEIDDKAGTRQFLPQAVISARRTNETTISQISAQRKGRCTKVSI